MSDTKAVISFSVSGQPVGEVAEIVVANVSDFRPWHEALKPDWIDSREEVFGTQGWASGTPWLLYDETDEALAYVHYKADVLGVEELYPDDVLHWGGKGERLYPGMTDPKHREFVYDSQPTTLQAGTEVPYAYKTETGIGSSGPDFFPLAYQIDPIPRSIIQPTDPFRKAMSDRASWWLGKVADKVKGVRARTSQADVLAALGAR